MVKSKLIFIVVMTLSLSGCATIMNGTAQKVMITSNPDGANVTVDEKAAYTTPVKVRLERRRDHTLVIAKDGYSKETVNLTHVLSEAVCGNILLGGIVGWIFDIFGGTQYKLMPNKVHVELKRAGG